MPEEQDGRAGCTLTIFVKIFRRVHIYVLLEHFTQDPVVSPVKSKGNRAVLLYVPIASFEVST